jgi:phosphoribosylaminoimidazolecarboxamide formyltransferase/IMP cyclohydrolase
MKDRVKIERALLSVTDKSQLEQLAEALQSFGCEIISSGGTRNFLMERGFPVTPIENVTGNPEAFGGRMKTISFEVGSALLYRRSHPQDCQDAESLKISKIDLVVCNLYSFDKGLERELNDEEAVELVDIGGPTMIRAAAKNYSDVAVATDPQQYSLLIKELKDYQGEISLKTRQSLSFAAFNLTSQYDQMIARDFAKRFKIEGTTLRYGENPQQSATCLPQVFQKGVRTS